MTAPYPYSGPQEHRDPIEKALRGVIDPEMSVNIVDLGLVYGVDVAEPVIEVRITMTSAACPVTELIVDEVTMALDRIFGTATDVRVALCWDPPWSPERMSEKARTAMGWD